MQDRWHHTLLALLLLAQLLLLTTREPARGSRLESWLLGISAPLAHGVSTVTGAIGDAGEAWRFNHTLREENADLRAELADARRELMRLMSLEEAMRRAGQGPAASLGDSELFVADVVYLDQTAGLRTLVLEGGPHRPVRNQAVRTPRGLVGRIIVTSGRYGKVQLITDRAASASAMIERTRRKGLVRGGDGGLELTLLPRRADVRVGDRIVTAGIDGVYPRGIPIGTVTAVEPAPGLFLRIELEPAVDFGLLEEVFVLTGEPVPRAIIEGESDGPP